jgi:leucyl aminopeptidase
MSDLHFSTSRSGYPLVLMPVSSDSWKQGVASGKWASAVGFSAAKGEVYPQVHDGQPVWILGLGSSPHFRDLENAIRGVLHRSKGKLPAEVAIDLEPTAAEQSDAFPQWVEAACLAVQLAAYDTGAFKTATGSPDRKTELPATYTLIVPAIGGLEDLASQAATVGRALIRLLSAIDTPPNYFTAAHFAAWAHELGEKPEVSVTVLEKSSLESLRFGALLGVNKGSQRPPTFSVVDYHPEGATHTVALVGKGVTFDTGGISIKPSENMHFMKSDLGGGATVMATVQAAIELRLPIRVIAAVPATDNMIGPGSLLPGDVITAYGGITIEVMDTDAEGRLILADALSYITDHYQPDAIVDLATLTGACVVALGYDAAGMFTANNDLADALTRAGEATRDRAWRMPLWDSYAAQLESDVADIKNLGTRAGGAVTAAKFLEKFTRRHPAWAHLDIAGVAFGDTPYAKMKAATGWGLRLLLQFIQNMPAKP